MPVEVTNSIGMKLALIPPGEFLMGSPANEEERRDDECQHRVRITKPFYLGVYEVTQEEYGRVMGTNPSMFTPTGFYKEKVLGLDTTQFPVEWVSWTGVVEFCRKLSSLPKEKTAGRIYRLPTEAEWEYACRAGTTTPFCFGRQLNWRDMNCLGKYPYETEKSLDRPTTVGSYAPNAFGLYDMHGNVSEWCQDWYAEDYYLNSPVDDPQGPSHGSLRVVRSGSFAHHAVQCRSALRIRYDPDSQSDPLGFRVAAVPGSK
jgi:formylglycine-generating enzyme required for sulfatase activity